MRSPLATSTLVLAGVAVVLAVVAYLKDPGLPTLGAKNGFRDAGPRHTTDGGRPPVVAYMTAWSLFGLQVVPSLAFPMIASWLVSVFNHE